MPKLKNALNSVFWYSSTKCEIILKKCVPKLRDTLRYKYKWTSLTIWCQLQTSTNYFNQSSSIICLNKLCNSGMCFCFADLKIIKQWHIFFCFITGVLQLLLLHIPSPLRRLKIITGMWSFNTAALNIWLESQLYGSLK